MPLLRIRTEIEDRPGRLALLTAALAGRGANILALSVQVDTGGVVDEFLVDVPRGAAGPRELAETLAAAGGARTAVRPARPHELVDEPTRALVLASRLRAEPHAVPEILAELLRADESAWARLADREGEGDDRVLTVPLGHGRAVRLRRYGMPFTATEAARADALVRAALPAEPPRPASRGLPLRDGTRVTVRPIEPRDAGAVRELHERCSLDSRRMRYFSPKPYPPPRAIERFCDPAHGLTLVAEGPDGSLLALAHLIHVLDPGVAELAFLVEDRWQGRGLGRALAELLLRLARERGLVELRATALSENVRMRRLLTSLGGRTRRTEEPCIVEIRLRADGRPAGGALAGWRSDRHL
ncbi:GNAT family N-acetyltransferase [Actinomadura sp. LD22]|uniref:GNAT family N-acetyltransferase n=1 Tax=Actinomadura physcomitrii TaxID=2650748 RepID=A0A6I4M964_9ACTN|nr:GNAT family N-acetyltransferase [Actinomadura physcomitrii]MWA00311.1 GNAT family N-acetyltransferase [Actinomadura physcomitrii]